MISLFQKVLQALKTKLGGRIDYDGAYGYQCVDYARWFAKEVGHPIGVFGGSAYIGFTTGRPFQATSWKKVVYKKGMIPPRGAIIFEDKLKKNGYFGHVMVVQSSTVNTLTVSEMNAGSGNGDGLGANAITVRTRTYSNILGWYELP